MGLLPATEGQQIIAVGQQKSGGGRGCAQCDQKVWYIDMTGPRSNSTLFHPSSATTTGYGKINGLTAYYNFVANPELGEKVVARRIPCGCAQCVQKDGISMTGGAQVNENYVDEQ
jgi:hypothetical protein